jgi:catechol 2,3-dioxygenase
MRCGAGQTLHHMAFELDGIGHLTAAADQLGAAGVPLEAGPGRHGVGGNLYAYFWAPGGNRYELSAEMPRVPGARDAPNVRLASSVNSFSAWGTPRPDTFTRGS